MLMLNIKKQMVIQVCHTYLYGPAADNSDACVWNDVRHLLIKNCLRDIYEWILSLIWSKHKYSVSPMKDGWAIRNVTVVKKSKSRG